MTSRPRVLVVCDGETPHVLAAVRSLSRGGFEVGIGAPADSLRAEASSRHAGRTHDVPRLEDGLDAYLAATAQAVTTGGYDVVVPGDDADLLALSWGRDGLGALLPAPSHDVIVRAIDKFELVDAARAAGLDGPRTVVADDAALAAVDGPVVVKARLHWQPSAVDADRHLEAALCADAAEAVAAAKTMRAAGGVPLLQEHLDGQLTAVSLVLSGDGDLLAVSQQESTRLSLRRTSVRARTVAVDDALVARVQRMLRSLGWHGLANVQLLRTGGGQAHVIDLNGRFYGSLALAVRSGADLPVVWVRDALGLPRGPVQRGRPGVRFHAFEEDLRRARAERSGGLARDLVRVVAAVPMAAHPTLAWSDPAPAWLRLRALGRTSTSKLSRAATTPHG